MMWGKERNREWLKLEQLNVWKCCLLNHRNLQKQQVGRGRTGDQFYTHCLKGHIGFQMEIWRWHLDNSSAYYGDPLQYSCLENLGPRSLVGCSPWGCEESDTTKRLHFHFSLSYIGGGNGNPLLGFLPGESQGWRSLVCCHLWGHTELDMTEAT